MNEKIEVKPQVISPLKKICMTIGELPTSYLETMTYYEMLVWFTNYLRDTVIPVVNNNGEAVSELQKYYIELQDYVNNYFDNLDVQEEINNKIDDMIESGELAEVLAQIVGLITANTFNLQRIGRKITIGTNPNSSDYNSSGIPACMQGGCRIDGNTIAYCLWDSINNNLNKNKVVVLNSTTGEIIRQQEFTFGWCNSVAYSDSKLYIAVRGTTTNGVSTNNGIIKVLDLETLSVLDTITLGINCNAISIYNDTLYVLEENTNKIYLYDLEGNYLLQSITISYDISGNYNQDILVTRDYIYLLSTRPSNTLRVFYSNGTHLKSYQVPKYGGLYKVGELQWIDQIDNDYLMLGTNIINYEENLNQFFKFSLTKNIATNTFQENFAQTLNVDSTKNYFNPDGTSGNEFTSINELDNVSIENIVAICNNKEYDYTLLTNHKVIRIQNAVFTEGLYVQYGSYYLINCSLKPIKNTTINACLYTRFSNVYLMTCSFDSESTKDYCIDSTNATLFKIASPTFSNYNTSVFSSSIPTDIIHINSLDNVPYIPRTYNREYNLNCGGFINQYKQGTYAYTTTLTTAQITELFNNATKIEICYIGLNKSCNQYVTFEKASTGGYTISDTSIAGSAFNFRCS